MSRFLKSQNYLMNYFVFVLLLGFISLGAIGGCSSNDNAQSDTQVLTEEDFATNDKLRANLKNQTVVKYLEPPESEGHDNDTGEVGYDIVPLRYNSTAEHTYCWEDEDEGAGHYMELDDSEGNEIFRLDVNGECITVLLEAGNYVMIIYHDAQEEKTHTVFIREIDDDDEQALETKGLINRLKAVASTILKGIKNTVSRDAIAQTVEENRQTLISTNRCTFCNLTRVNLVGVKTLKGATLDGSDLTFADLSGANLSGAKLRGTLLGNAKFDKESNLSSAAMRAVNLVNATLDGADLSNAKLRGANLVRATLIGTNLSGATLIGAVLIGADLKDAKLMGADLKDALLDKAIWCDGKCTCASPSFGTCTGCSPQASCTGL